MKSFGNIILRVAGLAVGISAVGVFAAAGGTVLSPVKRQEALDRAKKLLAEPQVPLTTADPFYPEAFAALTGRVAPTPGVVIQAGPAPAAPKTTREILQGIAANLKPSGSFVLNGEQTLVFGQKRVKAGGFLSIPFEGTEYVLEITAIERTHFTLRLNREEFTRPIN